MSALTERLVGLESSCQQLEKDLSDARTSLQNQVLVNEVRRRSEDSLKQLQGEVAASSEREESLKAECRELWYGNESLAEELREVRAGMEREVERRLKLELDRLGSVERERDQMRAELEAASSLVDDATDYLSQV